MKVWQKVGIAIAAGVAGTCVAVAVAVTVAFAGGGDAPDFPFKQYKDIPDVKIMGPACQDVANDIVFVTGGPDWRMLSSKTDDLFLHLTDGHPDVVYFTKGQGENYTAPITVVKVMDIVSFRAAYPDPCTYFVTTKS